LFINPFHRKFKMAKIIKTPIKKLEKIRITKETIVIGNSIITQLQINARNYTN